MSSIFNTVTIIGVGLMGGSLARAIKQNGLALKVIGASRNESHLQEALKLGVIDEYYTDYSVAVKNADLVVLAVPVGAMKPVLNTIKPALKQDAIITDVGSTKQNIQQAVMEIYGEMPANFVLGHPIAGTEQSGVAASFADLYQGKRVILTPSKHTDRLAISKVTALWQGCGALVMEMNCKHHDEVLAATSHLPHMIAYTLVNTLAHMNDKQEIFTYAAGGFKDFTRIASSDPTMWLDISLANKEALLNVLSLFKNDLEKLTSAIVADDDKTIRDMFCFAKQTRDTLCNSEKS